MNRIKYKGQIYKRVDDEITDKLHVYEGCIVRMEGVIKRAKELIKLEEEILAKNGSLISDEIRSLKPKMYEEFRRVYREYLDITQRVGHVATKFKP